AEVVRQTGLRTHLVVHDEELTREQPPVAVPVGDDLDVGHQLDVPLNEAADSGGQTECEATGGQESDALDGHGVGVASRVGVTGFRVYRAELKGRSRGSLRGRPLRSRGPRAPRGSPRAGARWWPPRPRRRDRPPRPAR